MFSITVTNQNTHSKSFFTNLIYDNFLVGLSRLYKFPLDIRTISGVIGQTGLRGLGVLILCLFLFISIKDSHAQTGRALNFDGTNDHVILPSSLSQNFTLASVTEITIEYWFKGTSLNSAILFQNGSNYIIAGRDTAGIFKHVISTDGGVSGGLNIGTSATDGKWHHISMTWKKNTINGFKSYIDGALVAQRNSANVNLPVISTNGYLGSNNGASGFSIGTIDEVRIWTRELSQSEIAAGRFQEISSGTGLKASYHFNQGIAGGNNSGLISLTDASSNGYNGTLTNFTLNGSSSNWIAPGLPPHYVSSFNPVSGPVGTEVTISGGGFSAVSSDNVVCFGTARAVIVSAGINSLVVKVPVNANFQKISITNLSTNTTAYSDKPFRVTFSGCTDCSFAPRKDFYGGSSDAFGADIADIDGDGKTDLIVPRRYDTRKLVDVFRNSSTPGNINFDSLESFGVGFEPIMVKAADFDNDGKPDLAVINRSTGTLSVLRNISTPGNVNFEPKVDFTATTGLNSLCVADFDRDGKTDIATSSGPVLVFMNTSVPGSISLESPLSLAIGSGFSFQVIALDVDNDGRIDLAATNAVSVISVFRNISSPYSVSFEPKTDFIAGPDPTFLISSDFDNDGLDDIFSTNSLYISSQTRRNISTIANFNFTPAALPALPPGSWLKNMSVADYNGNGKIDLTFANRSLNLISVVGNTSVPGTILFSSIPVGLPVSTSPDAPISADFDGDGKPDIASTNTGSISLFRNKTGSTLTEANVKGNGNNIAKGDTTPVLSDNTDFGSVGAGGSLMKTFKIHNSGSDTLVIDTVFTSGVDSTMFVPSFTSVKIAAGDSANLAMNFIPTGPAIIKNAKVNISTNDCDESNYNFSIRGKVSAVINVSVIPEGFYDSLSQQSVSDTIRAYLHSAVSPFNVVDSAIAKTDPVSHTAVMTFNNAPSGTYYIRLKHRNALETWSKLGGESFTAGTLMNYDFTNSASQSYQSNVKQVSTSPLRFAIFSGDVNQTGVIDLSDIISIYNDAATFLTGYVKTDATGDNVVNLRDLIITFNNSAAFVGVKKP